MTLLMLLIASLTVSLLIGLPAKLTPKELAAQTALMCLAAVGFYGLVHML